MSSEGFQLSQTKGGGEALCMTIGSLTPVKLGEGGGRGRREGVPICLGGESVHLYSLCVKVFVCLFVSSGCVVHLLSQDSSCKLFLDCYEKHKHIFSSLIIVKWSQT